METYWALSLIGSFFVAPVFICHGLGESRDRTGWVWGLLLGWLGVLILACMRPVPYDQRMSKPVYTAATMYPPPPPAQKTRQIGGQDLPDYR
jgi:hypothetical protein